MLTTAKSSSAKATISSSIPQTYRQELTQLFLADKRYFLRVADSILRNPADAEDALHSAFCSAWKAMDSFRGESTLKTWFSRVVQNAALITLRKRRGDRTVSIEESPEYMHNFEMAMSSSVEDPEHIAVRQERVRLMNDHIGALPEETRIVLVLHFSRDCSIDAIARIRKKSRPSVVAHLQRGKALLRKRVQQAIQAPAAARAAVVH
jgi:RNA polymerase sigma-70 factor (ECF subfamily)